MSFFIKKCPLQTRLIKPAEMGQKFFSFLTNFSKKELKMVALQALSMADTVNERFHSSTRQNRYCEGIPISLSRDQTIPFFKRTVM